jgi:hypothetical protein
MCLCDTPQGGHTLEKASAIMYKVKRRPRSGKKGYFDLQMLIMSIISEETYTLLQLTNDLEPKLHELRSMYCIHTRAVYDWKTSPNWLSASWYVSLNLQSHSL